MSVATLETGADIWARTVRPEQAELVGTWRWVLRPDGAVALKIIHAKTESGLAWNEPRTLPVFTGEWLGQWVQLTVTYDAALREVKHYFNGRLVSRTGLEHPVPLSLELLELGNLSLGPSGVRQRLNYAFRGAMDEVLILARVLSPSEILAPL